MRPLTLLVLFPVAIILHLKTTIASDLTTKVAKNRPPVLDGTLVYLIIMHDGINV